jgi:pilus assembly protein CpaE
MGSYDTSSSLGKDYRLGFPTPLTVIAAGEQIDALHAAKGAPWIADANLIALELDREITDAHLLGAGIVVVHVDPNVSSSMKRIEKVRTLRPDLPQIVALESADLRLVRTLVRQGVADVVSLPLSPEELLQVAIAVMEVEAAHDDSRVRLAPLVAVTRAQGGGGATTLATHLAAAFADPDQSDPTVCIFDLDIQFGRVAEMLGLSPRRNLTDLIEGGVRVDESFLASVAVTHSSGVAVVAVPQEIVPLESIDAELLRRALEIARRKYDYVFIDIPANLTNWNLSVLADASSIVMVVEQNLASLRQARRRLDLFRSVGIDSRMVSVVVNRIERRLFGTISMSDVEQALGHDVMAGLHLDAQNIATAQDQGLLVSAVRPKSPYAVDVAKLADMLRRRIVKGVTL